MATKKGVKNFTKDQVDYIISNHDKMYAKDIAEHLGTTTKRIQRYLWNHGMKTYCPSLFSEDDARFIEENYKQYTYQKIAEMLDNRYTRRQVEAFVNHRFEKKLRKFNDRYFEVIDTQAKAYWLGFIYADGSICNSKTVDAETGEVTHSNYELSIQLNQQDDYILEQFNECLGGVHTVSYSETDRYICGFDKPSHVKECRIRVYSKSIVNDLNNNGIDYNKTYTETFPEVSDELFPDFLRGFIDGDGGLYERTVGGHRYLTVGIFNMNLRGLNIVKKRLSDLYDIDVSIYPKGNLYTLVCDKKDHVRRLLDIIYYDNNVIKLKRKHQKYLNFYGLAA